MTLHIYRGRWRTIVFPPYVDYLTSRKDAFPYHVLVFFWLINPVKPEVYPDTVPH